MSGSPTERRRLSAEERGTQLLDVAEALFAARGFEGVSVEDIARAAGVTRPTIYQRHGSKEGIFLACVRRARVEFQTELHQRLESAADLLEKVHLGVRVFVEFVERDPRRWVLLFTYSASTDSDLAEQLTALRFETIHQIALQGAPFVPHGALEDVEALAHAMSGAGEQLARWWLRTRALTREQMVERYVTVVLALAQAWPLGQGSAPAPPWGPFPAPPRK